MKAIYLSTLIIFLTPPLFAQAPLIQNGLVREQNSGKRPVADVQIIFSQAVPTTSDQAGKFRLAFAGKKAGDLAFMTEIKKAGFELVNDKELEHITLSSAGQFPADIILAKAGVLDAAKKEYYTISDKALKAGFEKQKAILRGTLDKARLSEKQYQDQFEALQKQYENQKKELDNLSEKFAKVNFDDVSELYKEALELFKAGKIDEALQKLEGADLVNNSNKILEEEERLAKAKIENIQAIQLQAEIYLLRFQIDKAEILYDQLLRLDSTNLEILWGCAGFYRENHRYEKALRLYPKTIAHLQVEEWQKTNAHGHLGDLYTTTGNLEQSMTYYTKAYEAYSTYYKNAPNNTFYKQNLAISYEKLGQTYTALGNLDKALNFQKDEVNLFKELNSIEPNNIKFKLNLGWALQFLGITYASLDNLNEAFIIYKEMNLLFKELFISDSNNAETKKGLAISYQQLGLIQESLGNMKKALEFYDNYSNIVNQLFETYPNNVEIKEGLAVSYERLGKIHMYFGNLDKALTYYNDETKLFEELCHDYPSNVIFRKSLAISYHNIGAAYIVVGNSDKALTFYEKSNQLAKYLYDINPENMEFKRELAISYQWLGLFYENNMNDMKKAKEYYKVLKKISLELATSFPEDIKIKNNFKWVQDKLKSLD